MSKKIIVGALLGGLVLFIWQFIIHMVSGIYHDAFIELKDPVAVEQVIKENIPEGSSGGMLLLPYAHPKNASQEEMTAAMDAAATGFSAFGVLNTSGKNAIGPALGVQFVFNILGSGLLMFVMLAANPSSLGCRVSLALCFAVFGIIIGVLPNWNWWGYSWHYIGGQIGELVIGWALVGLVLAKVMGKGGCCPAPSADAPEN